MRFDPRRLSCCIAALWAGAILALAGIAAPAAFAAAPAVAGQVAGAMFAREAYAGLAVAGVLLGLAWHRMSREDGSARRVDIPLLAGMVLCTLAGHFGIQPLMAAARVGQGPLSFGALHALSAALFGLKGLLALALAWRLAAAG